MLVFYNDNKASFQQFVDMMRTERDRQYQEDLQMLISASEVPTSSKTVQDKQKVTDNDVQGSTKEAEEATFTEARSQREGVVEESKYEDNNDHGALRFVYLFIYNICNEHYLKAEILRFFKNYMYNN